MAQAPTTNIRTADGITILGLPNNVNPKTDPFIQQQLKAIRESGPAPSGSNGRNQTIKYPVSQEAPEQPKPEPSAVSRFLSAAGRTYIPELGIADPELAAAQREGIKVIGPEVVRYVPPLAVGIATAPASVPTGAALAGSLALQSAYGYGSSALSEGAAQYLSGEPLDFRAMNAAGIRGAIPQVPGGAFGRGALKEMGRIAGNVGLAVGTEMGARKAEGKSVWGESAFDLGFPASIALGSSVIGGSASRLGRLSKKGEEVSKEFAGATPLLSQLDDEFSKLEGQVLDTKTGAPFINRLLEDMTIPLSQSIEKMFPENPEIYSRVMKFINPIVSRVDNLRSDAAAASSKYEAAKAALEKEYASGRTVSRDFIDQVSQTQANAERTRALYSNETRQLLFGGAAPLAEDVALSSLQGDVARIREAVGAEKKRIFNASYEAVGIGKDTQVGEVSDLIDYIRSSDIPIADRKIAEDNVKKILEESGVVVQYSKDGEMSGVITNLALVNMRDELRVANMRSGRTLDAASARAKATYDVVSDYADGYIARNISEDVAKARRDVNTRFAAVSEAFDTALGSDIDKIDPKAFVSRILEEKGKGKTLSNLAAYKNAIYQMDPTDKGIAALADTFERKVHSIVKNGLVSKHLNAAIEGVSDFQRIDVSGLVGDLNALRNSGYPVEMLGLDPDKLRSLARITSLGFGKKADVTYGEFNEFLNLLPKVGQDAAAAKTRAFSEFRKAYRDSVLPVKKKVANLADEVRKAKLSPDEIVKAQKMAESDPIYMLVADSDQAKKMLSTTYVNNTGFTEALLQQSPETLNGLLGALKGKGRNDLVDEIKFVATYTVMRDMLSKNPVGASIINDALYNDMFNAVKPEFVQRLTAFKTILGPDGMKSLNDGILGQVKKIANAKGKVLGYRVAPVAPTIRPFVGAIDMSKGSSTGAVLKSNYFADLLGYYRTQNYRLAHALYADPITSKQFAAIGYNISRLSEKPTLAVAARLAAQKDEEMKAQQPQP